MATQRIAAAALRMNPEPHQDELGLLNKDLRTSKPPVLAFDLYGTLLDTSSTTKELATLVGEAKAPSIAAEWRKYQLEYTWRLNSMAQYRPFDEVTLAALHHALAEAKVQLPDHRIDQLMHSYTDLSIFPDVEPTLKSLLTDVQWVIFTNGTDEMVNGSIANSGFLRDFMEPKGESFVVTIEHVKRYKPAPIVYKLLARRLGKDLDRASLKDIWLVSGNPFDISGARAIGLNAIWVDRVKAGWSDRLGMRPTAVVHDLKELGDLVKKYGLQR